MSARVPDIPLHDPRFRYIASRDHAGADGLAAFAARQLARRQAAQVKPVNVRAIKRRSA